MWTCNCTIHSFSCLLHLQIYLQIPICRYPQKDIADIAWNVEVQMAKCKVSCGEYRYTEMCIHNELLLNSQESWQDSGVLVKRRNSNYQISRPAVFCSMLFSFFPLNPLFSSIFFKSLALHLVMFSCILPSVPQISSSITHMCILHNIPTYTFCALSTVQREWMKWIQLRNMHTSIYIWLHWSEHS